jgi:hypothetical protein
MSKIIVDQLARNGGAAFTIPFADGLSGQLLQTDGKGNLGFIDPLVIRNCRFVDIANPTSNILANVGDFFLNTSTSELFKCVYLGSSSKLTRWVGDRGTTIGFPVGQQLFTSSGTFTVPVGIYSIAAVLVGGGGGGHYTWASSAGGGGALAYANSIPVNPGDTITITIGAGGAAGSNGGDTVIKNGNTVLFTAQGGKYSCTSLSSRAKPVSGAITCYGGMGGMCSANGYGGGGGAGGYGTTTDGSDARGGDGQYGGSNSYSTMGASNDSSQAYYGNGSNGAGGGGAGYPSSTYGFGGGGGVGLHGRGTNGACGTYSGNNFSNSSYTGGKGGSGGAPGAGNSNSTESIAGTDSFITTYTAYNGQGGLFGGGGGGSGTSVSSNSSFCQGGNGGARIVWGRNVDWTQAVPDVTASTGVV